MSETKWTPPGYEVTRDGRVFSVGHNWRGCGRREIVQVDSSDGYPSVRLTIDGARKRYRVHQLVALTFHGQKPSPNHEVRHLDGDPHNNHADNLRWGTASENAQDRVRHGRQHRPDWSNPEFRERMSASMRGAKARKHGAANKEADHA